MRPRRNQIDLRVFDGRNFLPAAVAVHLIQKIRRVRQNHIRIQLLHIGHLKYHAAAALLRFGSLHLDDIVREKIYDLTRLGAL